jgi:EpsI family protein
MIGNLRFYSVYALLILAALYINLHADTAVPMARPLAEVPYAHREWRMVSQNEFSENVLSVLRPSDYLARRYAGPDGRVVDLYVGYHNGSRDSGEIHSPRNCLPGSGWTEISSAKSSVQTSGASIRLVSASYQHGESKELFLYWFQVGQKTLTDEYSLKLSEIVNSFVNRRREATFVRVSIPYERDEADAMAIGTRFIQDFYPVLREFIPA